MNITTQFISPTKEMGHVCFDDPGSHFIEQIEKISLWEISDIRIPLHCCVEMRDFNPSACCLFFRLYL